MGHFFELTFYIVNFVLEKNLKSVDIKYLNHNEIDCIKWEDNIAGSLNLCIYSHSWFLDSVQSDWGALVWEDYRAVMPVFSLGSKMYLPKGVFWTGIYSNEIIEKEVYGEFLNFISQKFTYADFRTDKFFHYPEKTLGKVSKHDVFQFDTLKPLQERLFLSTPDLKKYMVASDVKNYKLERIADADTFIKFVKLNPNICYNDFRGLESIIRCAVKKKAGVAFCLKNLESQTVGFVTALFSDNYVFVPFLKTTKGIDSENGRLLLIYHLLSFLEGFPSTVVLDAKDSGASYTLFKDMRAFKSECKSFHLDRLSKMLSFFYRS